MDMTFGIASVAVISVICYLIGMVVKATGLDNKTFYVEGYEEDDYVVFTIDQNADDDGEFKAKPAKGLLCVGFILLHDVPLVRLRILVMNNLLHVFPKRRLYLPKMASICGFIHKAIIYQPCFEAADDGRW